MGLCEERIVIVTGAGRGIGRCHALEFAREGAKVVVNDTGVEVDGSGGSSQPAEQVAAEVIAQGGEAVVSTHDVSTWEGAQQVVNMAVERFGGLDVLVNNAGILRDRMLVNMLEDDWDSVMTNHLRTTFAPSRWAASYWRERTKAGEQNDARIINTSSPSGLYGNVGQANYGAAKAGIASFTLIAATELSRYGVTVNAIAPAARTRMTENLGLDIFAGEGEFDTYAPEYVSPLVVWLGSAASRDVTGRVFNVVGGKISVAEGWCAGPTREQQTGWTPSEIGEFLPALVEAAAPNADINGDRPTD